MPIHPLPQFESDLEEYNAEHDKEVYERLKAPKTIVVRYGLMRMIGEFPYDGEAKPGCGSKIVVRSFRGVEMGEMLTSTCPNSGCTKSVTRKEMLAYIENSGGRQYPFSDRGKALRVASKDDLDRQARLEQSRAEIKADARERARRLLPKIKIVDVEPILSEDRLTFYYTSEQRAETNALARELSGFHRVQIDMRQVGARDEARLTADYERCGQYCCCKSFLKVLKPVSMRSAKVQKATLDPLKISGRCGRLMCCLRYEDETYETLRKRLPRRKKLVGTPEGDGIVVDTQILTQLVLVSLDGTNQRIAVPIEDVTAPTGKTAEDAARDRAHERARAEREAGDQFGDARGGESPESGERTTKKKRRRRRRRSGTGEGAGGASGSAEGAKPPVAKAETGPTGGESGEGGLPRKKRRRRRRRRSGPDSRPGSDSDPGSDSGSGKSG